MSLKEKAIIDLRKGYSPLGVGPNENLNQIFNREFTLQDIKDCFALRFKRNPEGRRGNF